MRFPKILLLMCGILLLTLLYFTAMAQPRTANNMITQVKIFSPVNVSKEKSPIHISKETSGSCRTHSLADNSRPDAWRCIVDDEIYDPCFRNTFGSGNTVICVQAPWSKSAVLLNTNISLFSNNKPPLDPDTAQPWALVLANGQRCTLITGATATIAGMRINYECTNYSIVVGSVDRTLPTWRVFYRTRDSLALNQIGVKTAWY